MKAVLLLLIFQSSNLIHGQSDVCAQLESNKCSSCLQIPGCVWCLDVDYTSSRCSTPGEHKKSRCNQIVDGDPDEKPTLVEVDLTDQNQVSPRTVTSKVRVGLPLEFQIEVEPAVNYPVDFYILMDLTATMDGDLNNLKKLALNISSKLNELTSKRRLAFGSFIDKVVAPYVPHQSFSNGTHLMGLTAHVSNESDRRKSIARHFALNGNLPLPCIRKFRTRYKICMKMPA